MHVDCTMLVSGVHGIIPAATQKPEFIDLYVQKLYPPHA